MRVGGGPGGAYARMFMREGGGMSMRACVCAGGLVCICMHACVGGLFMHVRVEKGGM